MLRLYIGTKNLSSWSLRPWLVLAHAGIPFEEVQVPYELPDWVERVRRFSPTGRVPVLEDGSLRIWESIAIAEYVAEKHPEAKLWPEDAAERALARAVSAEIHAGFAALRSACSMNFARTLKTPTLDEDAAADLRRLDELVAWRKREAEGRGPFAFGAFSIADAMLAPLCSRIRTYGLSVSPPTAAYVDHMLGLPALQRWRKDAEAEIAKNPGTVAPVGGSYWRELARKGEAPPTL